MSSAELSDQQIAEKIKNILKQRHMSIGAFAQCIGVTEDEAKEILDGKASLDKRMIEHLEMLFGESLTHEKSIDDFDI
ncbi:MAG: hypothetical protein J5934_05195 [Succinivibrio sp.]|nr:hypothetical protein [Succinivibrio sp.]